MGASISAGVYFAYGAEIFPCDALKVSDGFDFSSLLDVTAAILKPLALVFLSAFTLYSCAVSTAACLYIGTICGRLTMAYCLSDHIAFTHGAALMLTVFLGTVFIIISKEASLCRGDMKVTAPDPETLIKTSRCKETFRTFISCSAASMAVSVGAYLMLLYFRL